MGEERGGWMGRILFYLFVMFCATAFGVLGGIFGNTYFGQTMLEVREYPTTAARGAWNHTAEEAAWFASKNAARKFRPGAFATRNLSFDRIRSEKKARFDIGGRDVMVFLHMQKTGGTTVEKFLTRHLRLPTPCRCQQGRKRCFCPRSEADQTHWLFSRFSTGWSCGLHADWTELVVSNCVDNVLDLKEGAGRKRRYFYTTILREPTARFVSEWRHVQRGATWLASAHVCGGKAATPAQLPLCFDPELGWEDVSLAEFLDCPHNLAANRMTRMLADLTLVKCYDLGAMSRERRETLMLESAKRNLERMAFFGILEDMGATQALFEQTFGLHFKVSKLAQRLNRLMLHNFNKNPIVGLLPMDRMRGYVNFQKSMATAPHSAKSSSDDLSEADLAVVRERNGLDIRLYDFARGLFAQRLELLNIRPDNHSLALDVEEED